MLKTFGEDHFSVAQYGIIAITNLTSNADIRNSLGGLNACQLIVQMLRLHAFKVKEWENVLIFVVVCFFAFFCVMDAGLSLTPSCFAVSALQKLEHHNFIHSSWYIISYFLFLFCSSHKQEEAPVAVYGLYAIGKLSLNHDLNRQRFGASGGCEQVRSLLPFIHFFVFVWLVVHGCK